jgi:hypothetical protein
MRPPPPTTPAAEDMFRLLTQQRGLMLATA